MPQEIESPTGSVGKFREIHGWLAFPCLARHVQVSDSSEGPRELRKVVLNESPNLLWEPSRSRPRKIGEGFPRKNEESCHPCVVAITPYSRNKILWFYQADLPLLSANRLIVRMWGLYNTAASKRFSCT